MVAQCPAQQQQATTTTTTQTPTFIIGSLTGMSKLAQTEGLNIFQPPFFFSFFSPPHPSPGYIPIEIVSSSYLSLL